MKKTIKKMPKDVPKKPITSYFYYTNEGRVILKKENPKLNTREIARLIGVEWRRMNNKEKKPFIDKAEADKKRYFKEFREYTIYNYQNHLKLNIQILFYLKFYLKKIG